MSVSHPLLKSLKGYIIEILNSTDDIKFCINDCHPSLAPLCDSLEQVFRNGLITSSHTPFGLMRRDYWTWIENASHIAAVEDNCTFKSIVRNILENGKSLSIKGKGRLFIRYSLCSGILHIPIEAMVRNKYFGNVYNGSSILGDEILGEIFLSLVYQLSQIKFDLRLENDSFLDELWIRPICKEYKLSPCRDLGIRLGHVGGRSIVLKVEEDSLASEDNKIGVGDIIDELFGIRIRGWNKHRIGELFKQNKGVPVMITLLKSQTSDEKLYPGLIPLLKKLELSEDLILGGRFLNEKINKDISDSASLPSIFEGYIVDFLGSVDVGEAGDVSLIENAISVVLKKEDSVTPILMVTGEIGVKTLHRKTKKPILSHSYTEISSCGRRNDLPLIFAYIAGDTTCSIACSFVCYIFRAKDSDMSREILLTLADGFHRTHWTV